MYKVFLRWNLHEQLFPPSPPSLRLAADLYMSPKISQQTDNLISFILIYKN